jgi:hypothetical protein
MHFLTCFLLLFLFHLSAYSENEIDARFSINATSEPVSLDDMVTGWDGDYQKGELAYANLSWDIGFAKSIEINGDTFGKVRISRGYRIYYYLKFDEDTADYYRAQEQGLALTENKKLDLEVKHFESPSISLSYESPKFRLSADDVKYRFKLASHLYQPGHLQFGEIKGIAYSPTADDFSATLDYRYDQFKLPWLEDEQAYEVDKGIGYSFDLGLSAEFASWLASIEISDILARFYWQNAGVTVACLQTSAGIGAVCDNNGGNGRSDQKEIIETIPISYSGLLRNKDLDLSVHAYQHDRYYRLGIEKGRQTALGRFALFLYHPRLVGASWQADYFNLQFGADTLEFSQAHNIQVNMGVNWHW